MTHASPLPPTGPRIAALTRRALAVLALLLIAGCAPARPVTIRVLSYNILHGEGLDHRIDLERTARVIREAAPDLVALQEVDRGTARTARVDEPKRLGELTGLQPVFDKNIDFQGGDYGNAALSRLPIKSWENHRLPKSLPNEQRGMLELHVRAGGRPVIFFATHLDYHAPNAERMASAEMFLEIARERGATPMILAGDFNDSPDSPVLQRFHTLLEDSCPTGLAALTFPADKPDRRIDYILYTRSPGLRCVEYRVIPEPLASDHRPILAVFELSR